MGKSYTFLSTFKTLFGIS